MKRLHSLKSLICVLISILLSSLTITILYYLGFDIAKYAVSLISQNTFISSGELVASYRVAAIAKPCVGFILAVVYYFSVSRLITLLIMRRLSLLESTLSKLPTLELAATVAGFATGLIVAALISIPILGLPYGKILSLIIYISAVYIGCRVASSKKEELFKNCKTRGGKPKILDTSVIIDGRILDIIQTGFVEGKIVIPNFILEELRHIADSADSLKRSRGRLGLNILNQIKNQTKTPVEIVNWTGKATEVDSMLLEMALATDSFIVTNDFNLNKVAEFQKVPVLNVNELSNAVKAIVLPGQEMRISVIKDGKEPTQGVAYLNDGTMIVVENGRGFIGEEIDVAVTSVLQTSAGRMIFAKPL